jgi:hypothetical protein
MGNEALTKSTRVAGRWMVTGPAYPDGSGWDLCIQKKGKCRRCVAEFRKKRDAYRAAALFAANEEEVKHGD